MLLLLLLPLPMIRRQLLLPMPMATMAVMANDGDDGDEGHDSNEFEDSNNGDDDDNAMQPRRYGRLLRGNFIAYFLFPDYPSVLLSSFYS